MTDLLPLPCSSLTFYRASKLSLLCNWFSMHRALRLGSKTLEDWTVSAESLNTTLDSGDIRIFEFERRLRSTILKRRLFTTVNGYIGIGHGSVRRGDIICIALGGRMLLILRPINNVYKMIGECYIHGIMFGEAIRGQSYKDSYLEEFILL